MVCPKCGYVMGELDTECPRCKRMAEQPPPQLVTYVAQARAQGLADAAIRGQLVEAGWSASVVDSYLSEPRTEQQAARRRTAHRHQSGDTAKVVVGWALVVIVLAAMVRILVVAAERADEAEAREAARQDEEVKQAERQRAAYLAQERRSQAALAEQQAALAAQQKSWNTIAYLDSFQSPAKGAGQATDAQRKASWDSTFAGQWVRWEGEVVEVSAWGSTYSVSMRCGATTLTGDTRFEIDSATALSLNKGDSLRIEGRLQSHGMTGYRLTDVSIIANFGAR